MPSRHKFSYLGTGVGTSYCKSAYSLLFFQDLGTEAWLSALTLGTLLCLCLLFTFPPGTRCRIKAFGRGLGTVLRFLVSFSLALGCFGTPLSTLPLPLDPPTLLLLVLLLPPVLATSGRDVSNQLVGCSLIRTSLCVHQNLKKAKTKQTKTN